MIKLKTPDGRLVGLDDLWGQELREAFRVMVAQFGAAKTAFMVFQNGLPPLPHPNSPWRGPHSPIRYRNGS